MKVEEAGALIRSARLYGILDTGYAAPETWFDLATRLLQGGVQVLQIRAKKSSPEEIVLWSQGLRGLCDSYRCPLILNDHPALVGPAYADGAHVGQDDMSVEAARRQAGIPCLIGKSSHSPAQAAAAWAEGPDYLGFGPLFPTPTKPDYPAIGLDDIAQVVKESPVPIFCIGGIKLDNLPTVLAAGANRVVIVSGLLTAEDPEAYARSCQAAWVTDS
jgi:thiamine-phosphate pyrophosphorylase